MRRPLIHYWRSCSPAPTRRRRRRRSSCSRSYWLSPTTYLLQISSEKVAIFCAKKRRNGTQLLRRVQDRFFSCLLFCRQTSFSAKQENPLSKASCGRRIRRKQEKTTRLTRYYHPCCDSRVDLGFAHRRENPVSGLLEFVVTQPHLPTTAPIAAAAATEESSHSWTLLTSWWWNRNKQERKKERKTRVTDNYNNMIAVCLGCPAFILRTFFNLSHLLRWWLFSSAGNTDTMHGWFNSVAFQGQNTLLTILVCKEQKGRWWVLLLLLLFLLREEGAHDQLFYLRNGGISQRCNKVLEPQFCSAASKVKCKQDECCCCCIAQRK